MRLIKEVLADLADEFKVVKQLVAKIRKANSRYCDNAMSLPPEQFAITGPELEAVEQLMIWELTIAKHIQRLLVKIPQSHLALVALGEPFKQAAPEIAIDEDGVENVSVRRGEMLAVVRFTKKPKELKPLERAYKKRLHEAIDDLAVADRDFAHLQSRLKALRCRHVHEHIAQVAVGLRDGTMDKITAAENLEHVINNLTEPA